MGISRTEIEALPKIELHRHLEGAVRLETLVDIADEVGVQMPDYNVETLRPFVQMMPGEPRTSINFLNKFRTIRQFFRTPGIIARITSEAIADAAADNIKYMELRFTPAALCSMSKCSAGEVVSLVCEATRSASEEHDINVRLIVSMNRHESVRLGEVVMEAALAHRDKGVVALDIAGNEAQFPATPFADLFQQAKREGLRITVHAGEWGGASSIWDAIEHLGAERIGHGIRVLEDPSIVNVLVTRGILLEVCPTSNVHSGIVRDLSEHPLPKLAHSGLRVSLNTDDPLISNITLTDEIAWSIEHLNFSLADIKALTLMAARHIFLPDNERTALVARFERDLYGSNSDG